MAASKPAAVPDGAPADPPAAVAPPQAPAPAEPAATDPGPTSAPPPEAAATPPTPDPAGESGPAEGPEPRGPGVYEYVGETPATYAPQGLPPQTAEPGDVCELTWSPGDDPRWQATDKPVTRWPDNDPRAGAPELHDGQNVAHTEAEREQVLTRLGIDPTTVKEG